MDAMRVVLDSFPALADSRTVAPGEVIHIGRRGATFGERLCGLVDKRSLLCMQPSDATCQRCLDVFNEEVVMEYGLGK